jgi:ribosomal protein S18 acetylase RimI-like enzyme
LLAHLLARIDADGMPAYLESSNQRNLALYGRHGFEVTAEVAIPGGPKDLAHVARGPPVSG